MPVRLEHLLRDGPRTLVQICLAFGHVYDTATSDELRQRGALRVREMVCLWFVAVWFGACVAEQNFGSRPPIALRAKHGGDWAVTRAEAR